MKRIGLTGGIASGKSRVARLLVERGVPVIDADRVARAVVEPGRPALAEIADRWPGVVRDGHLDRKALGAVIFGNPVERRALEAILHPRIRAEVESRFAELEERGVPRAVYEAPLLVETGFDRLLDELIVVSASEEVQLRRLMERDGFDLEGARARLAAQASPAERLAKATFVIENDGDLDALRARLDAVWSEVERKTSGD
ncbi:dephospho-CoA kinase [Vulgatibacter incomptus]|uniref:Dephospho-CoA kinase n=1 Tax=Vulgatibacter incomptus TaxID=1391653 RepID=A0A0K1P8E3_9BACT|nr:dephospho-CoA kinase [Vulgatibacter incomptus]AKU89785.1 Dephospho-CoA kinase [Vulgatibacter incomptus]